MHSVFLKQINVNLKTFPLVVIGYVSLQFRNEIAGVLR